MFTNSFTAISTITTLRFSSATDQAGKDWYVDNVSVVVSGGGPNLLLNGNFESGASVGWKVFSCSSACSASVKTSTDCQGSTGWCYNNACTPTTNIQFLEQYFTTVVGVTYTVTYGVTKGGPGVGSGTVMYVNVL